MYGALCLCVPPRWGPWVLSQDSLGAISRPSPADSSTRKEIICSEENVEGHQNGLVRHLVWKWSHQLQALFMETQSSLAHPGKLHMWWGSHGRNRVQRFGPTWRRTSHWYWERHKRAPLGHAGSHSRKSCNCCGLQHRVCVDIGLIGDAMTKWLPLSCIPNLSHWGVGQT